MLQALQQDGGRTILNTGKSDEAGYSALGSLSNQRRSSSGLANWEPSYAGEKVDWYEEYVARHGRLSKSWLQQPSGVSGQSDGLEIWGFGLYNEAGRSKVVAPMEDGSVYLWSIGQDHSEVTSIHGIGSISSHSSHGLLFNPKPVCSAINPAVIENVSVDSSKNTAFFAVQAELVEVDLATLQVVSRCLYPSSISALSAVDDFMPLTVGTTLSLHLHDPRQSGGPSNVCSVSSRLDLMAGYPSLQRPDDLHHLISRHTSRPHAPLVHPGPLAIHHHSSTTTQAQDPTNGQIFVAGRFPSLLVYDRRTFPKLHSTIHSGARLCSITSVPMPFDDSVMADRRNNRLTDSEVAASKAKPGSTIISCGEYNGKGSLELYSVEEEKSSSTKSFVSMHKNRTSVSRSKLLSVATHGTRVAVSDGDGNICWVERDGMTVVRRWNINSDPVEANQGTWRGLWGSSNETTGANDVVRKLVPVKTTDSAREALLFWTGERVGLVDSGEGQKDLWYNDRQDVVDDQWDETNRADERTYKEAMRSALERQADEARFMRELGFG